MNKNRKLVLENGKVFEGYGFGGSKEIINELVFNTSVVGYQEILSDPKNYQKVMCLTYPVIGNYGLNDEDFESKGLTVSGLIVREYNDIPSNFRFTYELSEVMSENEISGIYDVDTREITRIIREEGVMKAMICDINKPLEDCLKEINEYVIDENYISNVSSKKVWYSRTTNPLYNVVAIDCGIKKSLVKILNKVGCNVIVVPFNISKEQILKYKPNGLLISDGPGNPNLYTEVIKLINELKGEVPIYGIGTGMSLISLAYGADVVKQKVGHNGSNYPVKELRTNKIEITSQNDLYSIDDSSISSTGLKSIFVNVIDNKIKGIIDRTNNVLGIEYDLSNENCKEDASLNKFLDLMKKAGRNK